MTNPYYTRTFDVTPGTKIVSQTLEDEFELVETGFETLNARFPNVSAPVTASEAELNILDGVTASTAELNILDGVTASTAELNILDGVTASTAEINRLVGVTSDVQTQLDAKAPLTSPALTGTPTAPTATAGTSTTQIATTAYVVATSFSASLPGQAGNEGKFVTTDGTNASWAFAGISTVTTATGNTTLTSTPTLLKITPTGYGVTVTLPDATTCSLGGPLSVIDNRGVYEVRVLDSTGTLLGFIPGFEMSHASLDDNSTAAGVWAITGLRWVGHTAWLTTSTLACLDACIDLGGGKELLIGQGANYANCYAVVYDSASNSFGSVTLIRTATFDGNPAYRIVAVAVAADKVLIATCPTSSTAVQAVVVTTSGTTITVNAAASTTLAANLTQFAEGCGLTACNGSYVLSCVLSSGVARIYAIAVSGTTTTIGSATTLDGTTGALLHASGSGCVVASANGTYFYTKYYGISGTTITPGSGTSTSVTYARIKKFFAWGSYFGLLYYSGTTDDNAGAAVVSRSGTATSVSNAGVFSSIYNFGDAMIVSASKVMLTDAGNAAKVNILTNTSGTASLGTAITLAASPYAYACLYVDGSTVYVGGTAGKVHVIDCSGTSPTHTKTLQSSYNGSSLTAASNAVLAISPELMRGSQFVLNAAMTSSTAAMSICIKSGALRYVLPWTSLVTSPSPIAGLSDRHRWSNGYGANTVAKIECIP